MTERFHNILSELTGLPLSRQTRAANIQCFLFGELTIVSDKKSVGEFALHLQSPWRLTSATGIIAGSGDLYQQADQTAAYDPDFEWDQFNANLRDIKLEKLLAENKLVVTSAKADAFGGLTLEFNHHISLTVFTDVSAEGENEYWRLIDFRHQKSVHYESWSTGYEIS